jgi:hypothetical protein
MAMVAIERPKSRIAIALKPKLRLIPNKCTPSTSADALVKKPVIRHRPNRTSNAPLKCTNVSALKPDMLMAKSGTKLTHADELISCCVPNHRKTNESAVRRIIGASSLRDILGILKIYIVSLFV